MNKIVRHKKLRITEGFLFSLSFLVISVVFIITPNTFIRNVFSTAEKIQILGSAGVIYFSLLTLSYASLFSRKKAIQITNDFLLDNSKYESLGKIKWQDIYEIKKLKKYSIEITLTPEFFSQTKLNLFKKILTYMHNWNYKESIIISTATLNCSREELFEDLVNTKNATQH